MTKYILVWFKFGLYPIYDEIITDDIQKCIKPKYTIDVQQNGMPCKYSLLFTTDKLKKYFSCVNNNVPVFIHTPKKCNVCGITLDFGSCRDVCDECDYKYKIKHGFLKQCFICKKYIHCGAFINHHISYYPERTVKVCRSCHMKIHSGSLFDEYPILKYLQPCEKDIIKFYSKYPSNYYSNRKLKFKHVRRMPV